MHAHNKPAPPQRIYCCTTHYCTTVVYCATAIVTSHAQNKAVSHNTLRTDLLTAEILSRAHNKPPHPHPPLYSQQYSIIAIVMSHVSVCGALGGLVPVVQPARHAASITRHPEVSATGVEDHVERLRRRANLHLAKKKHGNQNPKYIYAACSDPAVEGQRRNGCGVCTKAVAVCNRRRRPKLIPGV